MTTRADRCRAAVRAVIVLLGVVVPDPAAAGAPLAHLTGALLTRGTAKRTGPEVDSAIEFVGGSLEAVAGRDSLTVALSVQKKDLALGLDLVSEIVLSPTFPPAEVTRKVSEIQAAIRRSEEDPGTVASRVLARLVYPGHPYGVPVEGTRDSVARLTRDDVVKFYAQQVRPDTTVVAVVGAVTVDEARREITARLGAWARPAGAPQSITPVTAPAPPREETVKRELTQSTIMFGRLAIRQTDPDYFPLSVASYVLGGGSASRLYARVRDEAGLAYAVYSWLSTARYGAAFAVTAQTRTAEAPKVVVMVREELARMTRGAVAERELALAKQYLVGSFPFRLDTSGKVADFLVAVEDQGLGLDYADRYKERIARVTARDVQRVAAKYFPPAAFNLVIVGEIK